MRFTSWMVLVEQASQFRPFLAGHVPFDVGRVCFLLAVTDEDIVLFQSTNKDEHSEHYDEVQ